MDCGFVHYQGPTLAAGLILHDGAPHGLASTERRYCLVRRAHDPGMGLWSFPGGFIDVSEDPRSAALREAVEETGCKAEVERLLGLYPSVGPAAKRVILAVYVGRLTSQSDRTCEEVMDLNWFTANEIPWGELAFPSTASALRDALTL